METLTILLKHTCQLTNQIIDVMGNRVYNHLDEHGSFSHMTLPEERKCDLKISLEDKVWHDLYSVEVVDGHLVLGIKCIERVTYYFSPTLYGNVTGFGHINGLDPENIVICNKL